MAEYRIDILDMVDEHWPGPSTAIALHAWIVDDSCSGEEHSSYNVYGLTTSTNVIAINCLFSNWFVILDVLLVEN
jgi:hypothetical protein